MITNTIKKKIRKSFKDGNLLIKSVNPVNNIVEYKKITDILRHNTLIKDIHITKLESGKQVITTEDHSLFTMKENKIVTVMPKEYPKEIVIVENDDIKLEKVMENIKDEKREYMYDLSVEDNENFVLSSGILAHNSFSPPTSETAIAGFTQTRGYRWPNEQLANHITEAINYINLYPPITCYTICDVPCLLESIVLMVAASYALLDLASLWIAEEFEYSVNGINLSIQRSDKYQGLAGVYAEMAERNLERQKLAIARVIKGLRQSKYAFSRGTFLGPMTSGRNLRNYVR